MTGEPGIGPVRDAVAEDNAALLALAERCPMEGEIGLCISRRPDFFALNRLKGHRWRVGVVDGPDGTAVGCVAIAERNVYLHGRPARTMYVSDLKVHPDHRGGPAADALCEYAREVRLAAGGDAIPTFLTILAGNRSMQGRLTGPRGLPNLHRFATVRAHSISLLWHRDPKSARGTRRAAPHAGADHGACIRAQIPASRTRDVGPSGAFHVADRHHLLRSDLADYFDRGFGKPAPRFSEGCEPEATVDFWRDYV